MNDKILLGAVAYDPKVVTIWDGFREWFERSDLPFDYVLFSNYEQQVESHLAGQVNVSWNSPLAWIEAKEAGERAGRRARAIAMRDTDQDLTSVIVVRSEASIRSLSDLKGKRVAVGAADSPQATLIPLLTLAENGLVPGEDFETVFHDVLLGKHGDHIGGERDAARALMDAKVDAACMMDGNHLLFTRDGTIPAGKTRVLRQTEPFDHCNFTVFDSGPAALIERFTRLLLQMTYDDPDVRRLMDLEGLKAWKPARLTGYKPLEKAVQRFGTLDGWLAEMSSR
jgi:ABC-type phosphate/phosphonate transport system substrate-binding protein